MTPDRPHSMERAEALVAHIAALQREIEALLDTDCARPSLIPKAPPKNGPRPRGAAPSGRGLEIGQRIREVRRTRGMTQLELAAATGIRRPNVARLERGGNTPTIETLQRVATALGIAVTTLVTGD